MPDAATSWEIQVKAAVASVMDVTIRTAPIMDVIGRIGEHGRDARCTKGLGDPGLRRHLQTLRTYHAQSSD
jgi:hypothetical protein